MPENCIICYENTVAAFVWCEQTLGPVNHGWNWGLVFPNGDHVATAVKFTFDDPETLLLFKLKFGGQ